MTSTDITLSGGGFNGGPLTMSSREIASLCGKQHNHVMRDIREMLVQLHGEANLSKFGSIEKDGRNRDQPVFRLPKRECLVLVSGYSIKLRAKIVDRIEQLEAQAVRPAIPTNMVEALRLAADAMERAETAERTKAEIGSRREATAMATASREKREADRLRKQLGLETDYAAVKRMEKLYKGMDFNWRDLKKASRELDLPIMELEDSHYGKINAYHAVVWRKVYGVEIPHLGAR